MKHFLSTLLLLMTVLYVSAQETHPVNGAQDKRPEIYVFTNANVVVDYQTTLNNSMMVVAKGKVEAVGTNLPIPQGATVIDIKGKYIYPSMIDIFSDYGIEQPKPQGARGFFASGEFFI